VFSAIFVDRPRFAVVIALVMTLAGGLAMLRIPVSQLPDIVPPQVSVTTRFPGASAAVIEQTVAQVIEASVNGVDRMIYMRSNSANDGSYSLNVSFALGTNPDIATVNVNNRVQAALARLPQEVQRQGVTVRKQSSAILQFVFLYSESGEHTPLFLSNYVTINIIDRMARVPGVGQVTLFGGMDYSMRIWFEVDRLISLNLTPSDVVAAIQAQNVQAPVGRLGGRPIPDDVPFQINLETRGRLSTPEEFGEILIRANPDGSSLRVRDVARVELGAASMDTESRFDGKPAVTFGIYLAPGANAVAAADAVKRTLADMQTRYPRGVAHRYLHSALGFLALVGHACGYGGGVYRVVELQEEGGTALDVGAAEPLRILINDAEALSIYILQLLGAVDVSLQVGNALAQVKAIAAIKLGCLRWAEDAAAGAGPLKLTRQGGHGEDGRGLCHGAYLGLLNHGCLEPHL
jgi:multidrug efflux pump subunit AcrB